MPFWANPGDYDAAAVQKSATVRLVAGQAYVVEVWAKEGGGGDHASVAWTGPGIATRQEIPASVLSVAPAGCAGWCPPTA